jgi:hypothetical protein
MEHLMLATVQLVTAGFFAKAIGATIAIFIAVGFVLGFGVARLFFGGRRN